MTNTQALFRQCLFFTTNSLARGVTRLAEEAFRVTGLSPSHAFLMMLVNETPGIQQKELAEKLQLSPSTVTRFVDHLVAKGYVFRENRGKLTRVFPTDTGRDLQKPLADAWIGLYRRYTGVLGMAESEALARQIDSAFRKLTESP